VFQKQHSLVKTCLDVGSAVTLSQCLQQPSLAKHCQKSKGNNVCDDCSHVSTPQNKSDAHHCWKFVFDMWLATHLSMTSSTPKFVINSNALVT